MKDIKMEWTRINEKDRDRMGITRDEYALCRYVEYRGKDARKNGDGWCKDPKFEIADFVGISRGHLYRAIDKLEGKGLLKTNQKGDLKATKLWADGGVKCRKMLHYSPKQSVTLCYTNCRIMLHFTPYKCNILSHTPYKRDSEIDKLDITQPNGCFEGENLDASTSIKLLDPALLNVEIHDAILAEQTRPHPGPARGETSLGAAKPKASEIAGYTFAEFWEDYGFKRGSKANASKKWDRLTAAEITAIRDTLEIYKRETVTEDGQRGDKFKPMRKHPEFFLNAKTWEAYAEQISEEAARPKDEWDEPYQTYVEWVKQKYPNVAKAAAYLSKTEFVCHMTTPYVKGMTDIGKEGIKILLIRAHDRMEAGVPDAEKAGTVFNYQVHLLQERVKSRTV